MEIIIVDSYEEMSKKAAEILKNQIRKKENSTLGLATGSTPEGMYKELVEMYKNKEIDFKNIVTFNLDEYFGLGSDNEQSYKYYMEKHLFTKVNLKESNANIPSGKTKDPEMTSIEYDKLIEDHGGIDIQVLGIGPNGHIGFNEPSDSFIGETHLADLTKDTINANSRFFDNPKDVPKKAITVGMRNIMGAKKILLLACGDNKADIIKKTLEGDITPKVPASILQLHSNLTVIVDKKAGSKLK